MATLNLLYYFFAFIELYERAPSGVMLTNVIAMNELTFSWNSVDPNCLPDDQNIMFGCGSCQAASGTTATCTDLQIPSTCDFSVQNVVCGEIGSPSDPISVTLRGMVFIENIIIQYVFMFLVIIL